MDLDKSYESSMSIS